jgi:MYXO-CTERM domain-containing protein
MKTFVLAALVTLVFTSSAHAALWELSWTSEWDGKVVTGDPPEVRTETGFASGRSTATITPTTYGAQFRFDTAAGLARLGVDRTFLGLFPDTGLPFNVPEHAATGEEHGGLFLLPREAGLFSGTYTWTGDFEAPETFQVSAFIPGSGPAPQLTFSGTGMRSTVAASEPGVLAIALAALGALAALRRSAQ